MPLLVVLLLAALKTIPEALYRAAKMDGATAWETFRFVTLPAIKNTLIVVGVLQVIIGLQVFDLLYSLTSGGPGRDTYMLPMAIYTITFEQISLGYGSAVTVLLFAIIVAASLLILIMRLRRRPAFDPGLEEEDGRRGGDCHGRRSGSARRRPASSSRGHAWPVEDVRRRVIRLPTAITRVAFGIGISLLLFFFAAPIIWMLIASLQPFQALTEQPPALTLNLWLDGYQIIAGDPRWLGSLAVSLQTALLTMFFVIVLAAPSAYALARFDLPGKSTTLALLILVQMVPAIVMAIPVLRIFQIVGLTDTVAALVIVNVAFWLPLVIWLLRNFFLDVPVSLERAARIDGCSRLGTLFRVTVPGRSPRPRRGGHPDPDRDVERVPVRGDPRQPGRGPDHAADHRDPELPRRAQPAAATQPACRGGDGRRGPLHRPCPSFPPPDHLRPIRRVREGMTETRGSAWESPDSQQWRRIV